MALPFFGGKFILEDRLVIWLCRVYFLLLIIIGMALIVPTRPASIVTLAGMCVLIRQRLRRQNEFSWAPDALLGFLPLSWALNEILPDARLAFPLFCIQGPLFCCLLALFFCRWFGSPFAQAKLTQGIFLSLFFLVLFYSFLRYAYPPFLQADYTHIMLSAAIFYTALPISQTAIMGLGSSLDQVF